MDIEIKVVGQQLRTDTNLRTFVTGSQNFVRFMFDLPHEWDDLLVFAQFAQNGNGYNQYLDEENCVYLPPDIESGTCTLTLYGSGGEVIATTNYLTLTINEHNLVVDIESTDISQSLYLQLVNLVTNSMSMSSDVANQMALLIDRIDNIVAPEGDASLSEVVDARLSGYSGNLYQSLKSRIDADLDSINNEIVGEKNAIRFMLKYPFFINFSVTSVVYGSISSGSGAEAAAPNNNRIRSEYFFMREGDKIQFLDNTNCKYFVGMYDTNKNYIRSLKLLSNSDIEEVTISGDCFVRYVLANRNDSVISDSNAKRALISQIHVIRYSDSAVFQTDSLEYGTINSSGNLANGILMHNDVRNRLRTENLYYVKGSSMINIELNSEVVEDIGLVNITYYKEDFSESFQIAITLNGTNYGALVYDGYPYVMVVLSKNGDGNFINYDAIKIYTDVYIEPSYLPPRGNPNHEVSVNAFQSIPFNYMVFDDAMTSGRLLLPPNYSMIGKKVPLIIWVHGSGQMVNWDDKIGGDAYLPFLLYLTNEGFAVFDCYAWTSKAGLSGDISSPIMIYPHFRAYIEGAKYVCKRFNVDLNNVALLAKSQGGYIGHWAYMQNDFPFKAVGLFAPTVDPVANVSGKVFYTSKCRQGITNLIEFTGTETELEYFINYGSVWVKEGESGFDQGTVDIVRGFLEKNMNKIVSMIPFAKGIQGHQNAKELFEGGIDTIESVPQWLIDAGAREPQDFTYDLLPKFIEHADYKKFARCPVKFWCAFDDTRTSSYGNYAIYQYLINGGSDVSFREMPIGTGGHSSTDAASNALKSSGVTKLGITYTDIPTAFVEYIVFLRRYL